MLSRNRCKLLIGAILFCCLFHLPSQQPPSPLGRHLLWFLTDPYNLLFKTEGGFVASHIGVLGVSGLLMLPEDEVRYTVREHYDREGKTFFFYSNYLGTNEAIAIFGAGYGLTLLTQNRKLQDAAFTSIQSVAYAEALTNSYKYFIGRARPSQTDPQTKGDQLKFDPFSSNSSFPSGHATIAFALITPWLVYYPHWYTYILAAGAAGTAVARMGLDRHWGTDVFAGAGIGFFTGYFLSKLHRNQEENFRLSPVALGRNSFGISLTYRY